MKEKQLIMNNSMRNLLVLFSGFFIFACNSPKNAEQKVDVPSTNYLLETNAISNLVKVNHQKLVGAKGDLDSYKSYLNELNNDSLYSIPFALDFITTCIAIDNPDRDSVFLLFNTKFYAVTNAVSQSLITKYKTQLDQLGNNSNSVELKYFKRNLETCGIGIFSTEGMYYLDVIPDFFYQNFKNRVSDGVREFLTIRKDELKQGFSEDASLLISFEELYKRIKRWESFIQKYPNSVYTNKANSYYETYLNTLLSGMDNSRIFDFKNESLLPDVKMLYEKVIQEGSQSPTTKIISSYYTFLSRHNFKESDSIQVFLKAQNLSSMLGVQPQTR